ncbi:MAG: metallophosphoesterase [Luteolibacter sp.]
MDRRNFLTITLPLVVARKSCAAAVIEPELVFGVIADPQYADIEPNGTRFYRNSLAKLESAITDLNSRPLSFVVTLGDLIDRDLASFSAVMPIYAKLRHPHFPVCGNHDFVVADEDKGQVLPAMGLEKAYYSRIHGSRHFLFLDCTDIAPWRHPAGHPATAESKKLLSEYAAAGTPQAKRWNGGIGKVQMQWIREELDAAKQAGRQVIVFNHYPAIPLKRSNNLWNAEELLALFVEYDHIAAYMNGHIHSGNYGIHEAIHYVNFKGMVEFEKKTAYAIVRCFPDRLEIQGYGIEPDRRLEC